ncbi:MAG TPA: DUF5005 domain-containing protein [Terriglobia bacterium]|nr:DUF5005 domain-containing protein [Terriglobia bacterium]
MKRPGIAIALTFLALAASSDTELRAQSCTLPPAPGQGTIDSTFDTLMMQNGPGWTGADGSYSLALPDGDSLFLWSDSYIGTVNSQTRMRSSDLFQAHNSLTIWNPVNNSYTTVGYPPSTSSYFVPPTRANWFWVGGPLLVEPSPGVYQVKVMLGQWTPKIRFAGNSVATLSYPSMAILSIQPVRSESTAIIWGSWLLENGGYIYIYGLKDPGNDNKEPYVARVTSLGNLTNASLWQFWNATTSSWTTGASNATPMTGVTATTGEYSVNRFTATTGPFYMLTGMDPQNPPYPLWSHVTTYYSCSPQGPWSAKTTVYTTPEAGAAGCKAGTLVTYNAKAHPEFTGSTGILLSYNVNANDGSDLVCANDYIPRWVRIQIQGVTDAASAPEGPP